MQEHAMETFARPHHAAMPDVARELSPGVAGVLAKVGMAGIEVPLRLRDVFHRSLLLPARVDAFVSLDDPQAKGIHMSRLYLAVQQGLANEDFSFAQVERLLRAFVASQSETSASAHLRLAFEYLAERRSLLSDNMGWRSYPIVIHGALVNGVLRLQLDVRITYSSTCPCSAALSRQLIQKSFAERFGAGAQGLDFDDVHDWLGTESALRGTPHSQRSHADAQLVLASAEHAPTLLAAIDTLEEAVGTPVQAAVKRQDEQEFARLNAANLMFAEDAARRLKSALEPFPGIADFRVQVNHLESLHPHDAVAVAVKGVPGGFAA
jgi:GTP cyclohydrolase IB